MSAIGVHRRSSAADCRGVTLIEMLVVVCIIALIAAVAAPSVTAGLDSVRLRTASDSIAAFLNAAVNRSERLQQAIEIEISPKENRLKLYSSEPGFTRELPMPTGVTIQGDEVRRIVLLPGSAIPGMAIEIANEHGSRRRIKLDPMTGFPHVDPVGAGE
ncbi:MAG TPA: prepilin-type N-terminal cleavage/methylation domain-containing protein [Verrucomicrobiae bacterium]|nr:prepilin-type N-terminal cleavage/methylation domain-containing protein [Verrucomicrobiae bacterium]